MSPRNPKLQNYILNESLEFPHDLLACRSYCTFVKSFRKCVSSETLEGKEMGDLKGHTSGPAALACLAHVMVLDIIVTIFQSILMFV